MGGWCSLNSDDVPIWECICYLILDNHYFILSLHIITHINKYIFPKEESLLGSV